jgi:hypothetical protein
MATATQSNKDFFKQLKKYYTFYTGGFIAFVILVGILEQMGVPNKILGYMFLFATILRRGSPRAGALQRHGDRRGLDVGGQLHRHGRYPVPVRL